MRTLRQYLAATFVLVLVMTEAPFGVPAAADWDEKYGLEGLTGERAAYGNRVLEFMSDMDAKFFGRTEKLNSELALETRYFSADAYEYEVSVGRGPVIEKIGRMIGIVKKITSPIQKETVFSRYYAIDVHPKTPLVGILHSAFVVQLYADGTSAVTGWLDVLPGASPEEDLAYLKQTMDEVYEKYGIDSGPHRALVGTGHDDDSPLAVDNRYRRRTAGVGGSFFGSPATMMQVTENNFLFMTEAYERFVDAYMDTIEKRKDDPYSAEDLAAQDAARRNWLEDQLFSDPYSTRITPYEVWSFAFAAPVVKF